VPKLVLPVDAVSFLLLLAAYSDWALNWSLFCARLEVPHLVIAFDAEAAAALHMHGVMVHDASTAAGIPALPDMRMDLAALRHMVSAGQCLQTV
jgi:hypothetical protein